MGGKALSKPSVRLTADQYHKVASKIMSDLRRRFPANRFEIIPAYRTKPDFGDLDILFSGEIALDEVSEALCAVETVNNGPVSSHGVEIPGSGLFQVDLIHTDPEEMDFALRYFAFNDLGNLIGRIAHAAGFKLGHNGLRYVIRYPDNPDRVFGEATLTLSWGDAITFLGYDSNEYESAYQTGFRTLDDVFKYAASSELFSPELYAYSAMSHRARVRDKKRPTYRGFLEWIENTSPPSRFAWEPRSEVRQKLREEAESRFPNFHRNLIKAEQQIWEDIRAKNLLNGKLVQQWTGLQGKDLGVFFKRLKESVGGDSELKSYVLKLGDLESVRLWVEQIAASKYEGKISSITGS